MACTKAVDQQTTSRKEDSNSISIHNSRVPIMSSSYIAEVAAGRGGGTAEAPGRSSNRAGTEGASFSSASSGSATTDPLAPLEWKYMDQSNGDEEDVFNIVELDQEELEALAFPSTSTSPQESGDGSDNCNKQQHPKRVGDDDINGLKRSREEHQENEEEKEYDHDEDDEDDEDDLNQEQTKPYQLQQLQQQGREQQHGHEKLYSITADERPRVSRRRNKKKNKTKIGGKSLPKRPMNAFGIFYHQARQKVVAANTNNDGTLNTSLTEENIQKQVGKEWRSLDPREIQEYEKMAEDDKMRYHQEMQIYSWHGDGSNAADAAPCPAPSFAKRSDHDDRQVEDYKIGAPLRPPPSGFMVISASTSYSNADDDSSAGPVTTIKPGSPANVTAENCEASAGSPDSSAPTTPRRWSYSKPSRVTAYPIPDGSPPPTRETIDHQPSPSRARHTEMNRHHREVSVGSTSAPGKVAAPNSSWTATPPPSSPYSHHHPLRRPSKDQPPAPPLTPTRSYAPHFGRPARPAYAATSPQQQRHYYDQQQRMGYSIPPGMELALPSRNGEEEKYRVSYQCYTMRSEEVGHFLSSIGHYGSPRPVGPSPLGHPPLPFRYGHASPGPHSPHPHHYYHPHASSQQHW